MKQLLFQLYNHFYSHAREGRDNCPVGNRKKKLYFYSHARERRDAAGPWIHINSTSISTHTPARGVTTYCVEMRSGIAHFYSHAREGRDLVTRSGKTGKDDFYSHAREGRDSYILYFREITPPYNARRTYFFNDS